MEYSVFFLAYQSCLQALRITQSSHPNILSFFQHSRTYLTTSLYSFQIKCLQNMKFRQCDDTTVIRSTLILHNHKSTIKNREMVGRNREKERTRHEAVGYVDWFLFLSVVTVACCSGGGGWCRRNSLVLAHLSWTRLWLQTSVRRLASLPAIFLNSFCLLHGSLQSVEERFGFKGVGGK